MSKLDTLRQRMRERATPRNNVRWYDIRNADGDKAVLRIYDEIHWLFGVTPEDFARELDEITASEIEVQINSPGGDVFDGIAIYNALRAHNARITTRVDGIAASIASVIAQAGDHRIMLSGSQMMIHEAWGLAIGPAGDMREMADLLDKQTANIAAIYAERSGGDADEFRQKMASETWLTAEETVDADLADEVVVPERRDAQDKLPPAGGPAGKTLRDQISEAVDAVTEAVASAERVDALRAEKGKSLSQVNRESLGELQGQAERLRALLDAEEAGDDSDARLDFEREYARFVATTQGVG